MTDIKKYRRGDQVAVLVSPGHGDGWSTWVGSKDARRMLFCPEIVEVLLESGDKSQALKIANELFPGEHFGGMRDLEVQWVTEGSRFEITEYDGFESVVVLDDSWGYVA